MGRFLTLILGFQECGIALAYALNKRWLMSLYWLFAAAMVFVLSFMDK